MAALLPFLTFLFIFLGMGIWGTMQGQEMAFYQFPAPSSALIGFGVALLIGRKRVSEQVKTFTQGIGEETVILMCLIFLLSGAFSAITKSIGSVESIVNFGLTLLPGQLLLPGLFLIACLISLAMGTSMGTIGTVLPMAIGMSERGGLALPLVVGTVVGGAMFGDNLSIISDTTVAATATQGCSMRDKMKANLKVALPAAAVVFVALFYFSKPLGWESILDFSIIKTIPYLVVLALALLGINLIAVLMIGIAVAFAIGMLTNSITFLEFGQLTYQGFTDMASVFYLSVLIAGLAAIATREGGLDYILKKLEHLINSRRGAGFGIAALVSVADLCIANNTIAILVTGKTVRKLADKFKISPAETAGILDIFSCVWQGLIPYGAQLLLASGLAKISPFQILPYIWYPFVLLGFAIIRLFSMKNVQQQ